MWLKWNCCCCCCCSVCFFFLIFICYCNNYSNSSRLLRLFATISQIDKLSTCLWQQFVVVVVFVFSTRSTLCSFAVLNAVLLLGYIIYCCSYCCCCCLFFPLLLVVTQCFWVWRSVPWMVYCIFIDFFFGVFPFYFCIFFLFVFLRKLLWMSCRVASCYSCCLMDVQLVYSVIIFFFFFFGLLLLLLLSQRDKN